MNCDSCLNDTVKHGLCDDCQAEYESEIDTLRRDAKRYEKLKYACEKQINVDIDRLLEDLLSNFDAAVDVLPDTKGRELEDLLSNFDAVVDVLPDTKGGE